MKDIKTIMSDFKDEYTRQDKLFLTEENMSKADNITIKANENKIKKSD